MAPEVPVANEDALQRFWKVPLEEQQYRHQGFWTKSIPAFAKHCFCLFGWLVGWFFTPPPLPYPHLWVRREIRWRNMCGIRSCELSSKDL